MERIPAVLQWVTREMDSRYKKFAEVGARHLADYNETLNRQQEQPLPRIVVLERLYEKGKTKDFPEAWRAGLMTDAKVDAGTKTATFQKIEEIIPPTPKTLNEARGTTPLRLLAPTAAAKDT